MQEKNLHEKIMQLTNFNLPGRIIILEMESKHTHGGARPRTGRKNENAVAYKTTVPGDLLKEYLKYYPKINLNLALKEHMTNKIAEAKQKELLK